MARSVGLALVTSVPPLGDQALGAGAHPARSVFSPVSRRNHGMKRGFDTPVPIGRGVGNVVRNRGQFAGVRVQTGHASVEGRGNRHAAPAVFENRLVLYS